MASARHNIPPRRETAKIDGRGQTRNHRQRSATSATKNPPPRASYVERAVLIPVGAALIARERVVRA